MPHVAKKKGHVTPGPGRGFNAVSRQEALGTVSAPHPPRCLLCSGQVGTAEDRCPHQGWVLLVAGILQSRALGEFPRDGCEIQMSQQLAEYIYK